MNRVQILRLLLVFIIIQSSCATRNSETKEVRIHKFQELLDSSEVEGSILIFDANKNTFYSNDFDWAKQGFLPASTFKIANSINALENGIVKDTTNVFLWDGQPKFLKSWEEYMNFFQAYQRSCVPCYQQIARKTGVNKMKTTLEKIGYQGMIFDSTSIDNFWLEGDSKISQFEQIDFLQRLFNKQLPISENTYNVMKQIMLLDENPSYKLYGKTGWAQPNDSTNIGWFVGYAVTPKSTYFIATNIQPSQVFDSKIFITARMAVSLEALESVLK
jgi:beta-lactamase class D OXA-209